MKRERRLAVRRLDRRYPVVPLFETLIAFLLETAARLSEALTLRWQDINFTDETAFFADTKNGSSRTVPIQRFTIELLRALPRTGDWVFDLTEGAYDGAWERIAERAGLREKVRSNKKACEKDFHTHDLRHEALSRISEVGQANDPTYDVFALKAISGHKDITSLARYINPIPKLLTKRLNRSFAEAGIMLDAGAPRRIVRARQPHPQSRTAANVIAFPARQRPKPSASAKVGKTRQQLSGHCISRHFGPRRARHTAKRSRRRSKHELLARALFLTNPASTGHRSNSTWQDQVRIPLGPTVACKIAFHLSVLFCRRLTAGNRRECGLRTAGQDHYDWNRLSLRNSLAAEPATCSLGIDKGIGSNPMPPIDLNVPFHEKDDAKRLGARWDRVRKTWFLSDGTNVAPFTKWLPQQPDINHRCSSYFIAQSTRICWHCNRDTRVFSFLLPCGHEARADSDKFVHWERQTSEAIIYYVTHIPSSVQAQMRSVANHYRNDFSRSWVL